jgi:hypothetical protein
MSVVDVLYYCADVRGERKFEVMAKEMNRTQKYQFLQHRRVQNSSILRSNRLSSI